MISLLIFAILLILVAWLAFTYLPAPFGTIVGVVVVVILLVYLLQGAGGLKLD